MSFLRKIWRGIFLSRLLVVSNRLPIRLSKEKGRFKAESTVGGLATGIGSIYKDRESLWIGWSGFDEQRLQKSSKEDIYRILMAEKCYPVFLTAKDIRQFYQGFSNNTIWPLFHYFSVYTKYDQANWLTYKAVNEKFLKSIMEIANKKDTFWIQDYHLMLLPQMIRENFRDSKIGFFLHIPFPSFEIFRLLPWRTEILQGILGANLVGFHTYDYVRHFLSSVRRILGYENTLNEIQTDTRRVKTDLFPMGIDYDRFFNNASSIKVQKEVARIRKRAIGQKFILSFDRLDYTKGIPLRLEAFEYFLEKKPEFRGKVTLLLVTVPSREDVSQYKILKKQIDELVGRINGKFSTTDWLPIVYFSHFLPFKTIVAMYAIADVGLVTPLRDGMNLIAKEFIASKTDAKGVLILSEMAGASQELSEALIVNPENQEELINAIETALYLPGEEQEKRNRIMQRRLKKYDIKRWAGDFLNELNIAYDSQQTEKQHFMNNKSQQDLIENYQKSRKRLLLLDYDGTLVTFSDAPDKAKPTSQLLEILKELSLDPKNELVIISGRDRHFLNLWFGGLYIGFIAEHGAWIKDRSGKVEEAETISTEWKNKIYPLLEKYIDRTPGSFVEDKPYSLVWHYRKTDPILGTLRSNELRDDLMYLTSNLRLAILEGNKIVEVKDAAVNKGVAAQRWLSKSHWDFILAIGDDITDEDLFEVLPSTAYSIKVGIGPSKAMFNLFNVHEVLALLYKCIQPSVLNHDP